MDRRSALAALLFSVAFSAGLSGIARPAHAAESWPAKPITMVVPFPPGGSTDAVARFVAQHVGDRLGRQIVVDNRPGAGGNLGTEIIAKAAPDGYTIGLATSAPLANNKYLYKSMAYDPLRDLTPIAAVGEIPLVIAANPAFKANDLKQLTELARAQPGKLSIGNPGNGTIGHLTVELLKAKANIDMVNVPYKGDTPAMTDVIGGTIEVMCAPVTALIPNIQSGKLKALAVTSRARFAQLPQAATAVEQGVDIESTVWFAVVGPAGLPPPVVARLNKEIDAILATPEARASLAKYAATPLGGTPEQLGSLMAGEGRKWKSIIDAGHITLD